MSRRDSEKDPIEYLLDLHEETMEVGNGYWVTIRAWRVEADAGRPAGVRYALSLHSPGGRRLVGYDNAHLPDELKVRKRAAREQQAFDHIHYEGRAIRAYGFQTPWDLLDDFWKSVELKLKEEGVE